MSHQFLSPVMMDSTSSLCSLVREQTERQFPEMKQRKFDTFQHNRESNDERQPTSLLAQPPKLADTLSPSHDTPTAFDEAGFEPSIQLSIEANTCSAYVPMQYFGPFSNGAIERYFDSSKFQLDLHADVLRTEPEITKTEQHAGGLHSLDITEVQEYFDVIKSLHQEPQSVTESNSDSVPFPPFPNISSLKVSTKNNPITGFGVLRPAKHLLYVGDLVRGERCGYGVLRSLRERSSYRGSWKHNRFHGQGKIKLASGICYDGSFENDMIHGQGVLTEPTGNCFQGSFKSGYFHYGTGEYVIKGDVDARFSGYMYDSLPHGTGHLTLANGSYCEGTWSAGKLVQGVVSHTDVETNSSYVGAWRGAPDGSGEYRQGDGQLSYIGEFHRGKADGNGTLYLPSLQKMSGKWVTGRFVEGAVTLDVTSQSRLGRYNGPWVTVRSPTDLDKQHYFGFADGLGGDMLWADGNFARGSFSKGTLMNGKMSCLLLDGSHYTGRLIDGCLRDKGFIKYNNGLFSKTLMLNGNTGVISQGGWSNKDRSGQGSFTSGCGQYWARGSFQGPILQKGVARELLADGSVYEGDILNDLASGTGRRDWSTGYYEQGIFSEGTLQEGYCLTTLFLGEFRGGSYYTGSGILVKDEDNIIKGTWREGDFVSGKVKTMISYTEEGKVPLRIAFEGIAEGRLVIARTGSFSVHCDDVTWEGNLTNGVLNGDVVVRRPDAIRFSLYERGHYVHGSKEVLEMDLLQSRFEELYDTLLTQKNNGPRDVRVGAVNGCFELDFDRSLVHDPLVKRNEAQYK